MHLIPGYEVAHFCRVQIVTKQLKSEFVWKCSEKLTYVESRRPLWNDSIFHEF